MAPDDFPGGLPYFAYGSNMGTSRLRARCPTARQIGIGRVSDHRIAFTRESALQRGGVADLVPAPRRTVWGAFFDLAAEDFKQLDAYEGVPTAYTRAVWPVGASDGTVKSAWVYVVAFKGVEKPPSEQYWRLVVDGAREAGLPDEYVAELEAIHHVR